MQRFANPALFTSIANKILPSIWGLTFILFGVGLYGALISSPPDYQQEETARIMYVHVPAAWSAMLVYIIMAIASATAFIFRHPLADVAAKTAAPIGLVFCFLSLVTGSIWGKPMWHTWWAWDPRLTSMFILLLLYVGYIAIWQSIEDKQLAASNARILCLVGLVNIPIIKFSVNWWYSIHQEASVLRLDGPAIETSMLWPLLVMGAAYNFLFLALHLVAIKTELLERKRHNLLIRQGEYQ